MKVRHQSDGQNRADYCTDIEGGEVADGAKCRGKTMQLHVGHLNQSNHNFINP